MKGVEILSAAPLAFPATAVVFALALALSAPLALAHVKPGRQRQH